jgi:cell shape-determining protein MreD
MDRQLAVGEVAMRIVAMVAVALTIQRALGWPGGPTWAPLLLLPMVFLVGPALLHHDRRWVHLAIILGLAWDVVLESVIGPGGIAWSIAALVTARLAGIIADRSAKAWFAFGAVGAATLTLARQLVLLPLGISEAWRWTDLALSVGLTALWCGLVGWTLALDLPARWRSYRARKLR